VRRSVSTAYYALFHFLVDEAGRLLIGAENKYRRRRHVLGRSLTHEALKVAMGKVRGPVVDPSVPELFRPTGRHAGPVASPLFAQEMAAAFADAQSKRHDADYDLNKKVTASDAKILVERVEQAIAGWAIRPAADNDFKHSLCLLILLKGRIRNQPD
jgi:hypothetical protein